MARWLGAAVATAAGAVSYYYRPLYDETSDGGCSREKHTFTSTSELCDRANQIPEMQMGSCPAPSLLYRLAQHVVVFSCTTTSRIFLYFGGQFRVKEDEHYAHFVATVRRRDPGVPLITVSNHRSMLDDPFLMASVLPLQMSYQHRYLRWGICSQVYYCYFYYYHSLCCQSLHSMTFLTTIYNRNSASIPNSHRSSVCTVAWAR